MKIIKHIYIIKKIISLSVCMILTYSSFSCIANDSQEAKVDSIKLGKIDLQEGSLLYEIISNTVSKDSVSDYYDSYQVFINEYKSGHFVKIVKSKYNLLKTTAPYSGYSMLKGHYIIFGHAFNYKLNYPQNPEPRFFRSSTVSKYFLEDSIIEEWYYYILDDIYARYDQKQGWIWSDGKPDE